MHFQHLITSKYHLIFREENVILLLAFTSGGNLGGLDLVARSNSGKQRVDKQAMVLNPY